MSSGKAKSNKNNGKAKDDLDVNEWEEMRELERKAIRKEQEEKRKNKMKSGKTEDMDASPPWKSKTFIKTPKLVRQDSDEDEIWEKIAEKKLGKDEGFHKNRLIYNPIYPVSGDTGKKYLERLRKHDAALLIGSVVRGHNVRKTKKRKRKEKGKSKAKRTQKRKKNNKKKKKKRNKKRKQKNNKTRNNKTKNNKTRKKSKN